jgi:hypothetical protein
MKILNLLFFKNFKKVKRNLINSYLLKGILKVKILKLLFILLIIIKNLFSFLQKRKKTTVKIAL